MATFPIWGLILGLAGGAVQALLLRALARSVGEQLQTGRVLLILLAKIALYVLLLLVAVKISILDGAVCGIAMATLLIGSGIAIALRGSRKR